MERYNIFHDEHQSLRMLLADTAQCIQRAGFDNNKEMEDVQSRITEMIAQITEHQLEEDRILSVLWDLEPGIMDIIKTAQRRTITLANKLSGGSEEKHLSQVEKEKKLSAAFNEFYNACIQQMVKEEELLNCTLWRYFSDQNLTDLHRQGNRNAATKQAESNKCSIYYLSDKDIVLWLKCTGENASEKAFHTLLSITKKELPDQRFNIIMQLLSEELKLT